jgi:hypothetical protein
VVLDASLLCANRNASLGTSYSGFACSDLNKSFLSRLCCETRLPTSFTLTNFQNSICMLIGILMVACWSLTYHHGHLCTTNTESNRTEHMVLESTRGMLLSTCLSLSINCFSQLLWVRVLYRTYP